MQWWLSQILRFGIGGGGLVWETLADHLRTPTALVVFGGVATAEDVIGYVRSTRERREQEREQLARELRRLREQQGEEE